MKKTQKPAGAASAADNVDCDTVVPVNRMACMACLFAIGAVLIFRLSASSGFAGTVAADGSSDRVSLVPGPLARVYRHSPLLDAVLDINAQFEVLATGFQWSEGPTWVQEGDKGYLLFSDVKANRIYKWSAGTPGATVFLEQSGYEAADVGRWHEPGSNGLAVDPVTKRVTLCEHSNRQVSQLVSDANGRLKKQPLAQRFQGKRLNSPNDLVFDATTHSLWFTDPPYGLQDRTPGLDYAAHPFKELDVQGIYLLRRASPSDASFVSSPELLSAELPRPNGIALSPDGRRLYVANSDDGNNRVHVFDVERDANSGQPRALANNRLFVNFSAVALGEGQASSGKQQQADIAPRDGKLMQGPGNADGLKVDVLGNVWATGPSGVFIFTASGEWIGSIRINGDNGYRVGNLVFDHEGWLYICADDIVLRVRTLTRQHLAR